jgi:hypothetical protein
MLMARKQKIEMLKGMIYEAEQFAKYNPQEKQRKIEGGGKS